MKKAFYTAMVMLALVSAAYAQPSSYHISFTINTAIDHVFVYADEWNGQVYAWDLFPIALGTVPAGTSSYNLGAHNVAAWAVIATHGAAGVATGINSSINPPDGLPFETVFPGYAEDVVRSNIATLYNGAYNVPQAYYLTEYVLAVEDTLKTDFPTGTLQVYTFTGAVDVGTLSVALGPVGCRGDMNCDGLIDFSDIDVFVAILSGGTPCNAYNADVNGDGVVDFGDIDPFVAVLSAGTTCP